MDGATGLKMSLADALDAAWARCRRRLEADGGQIAARIAEQARLAVAVHAVERVRRAAAAEYAGLRPAGRTRP